MLNISRPMNSLVELNTAIYLFFPARQCLCTARTLSWQIACWFCSKVCNFFIFIFFGIVTLSLMFLVIWSADQYIKTIGVEASVPYVFMEALLLWPLAHQLRRIQTDRSAEGLFGCGMALEDFTCPWRFKWALLMWGCSMCAGSQSSFIHSSLQTSGVSLWDYWLTSKLLGFLTIALSPSHWVTNDAMISKQNCANLKC